MEAGIFNDVLIVFHYFQSFLKDIQYTDFYKNDMITPSPQRLLRTLNAVVNFDKFRDICWSFYEPISAEMNDKIQAIDQLEDIIVELSSTIKEITAQNTEEEPEVRKLNNILSDVDHELQEFRVAIDSLVSDHEKLKKKRQELKDSLETSQFCILEEMELSNHYKRLKDCQVDVIRGLTAEAEKNLVQVKEKLAKQEESNSMLILQCGREKNALQLLHRVIDILNNINSTRNTFNRSKKTNDSVTKELNALESDLQEVNMKVEFTYRQIEILTNRRERLEEQQIKKQESMNVFREGAIKSDQELKEELQQIVTETERLLQESQAIENEIEDIQKVNTMSERTLLEHITRFKLQVKNAIPANMLL
ncbi:unnamed protein product [Mucor hiemalis]